MRAVISDAEDNRFWRSQRIGRMRYGEERDAFDLAEGQNEFISAHPVRSKTFSLGFLNTTLGVVQELLSRSTALRQE